MGLILEDVRDYVKLRLGAGVIRVELKDAHIDASAKEALRIYSRYRPLRRFIQVPLIDGITEYALDTDVLGVYKMDFVTRQISLAVVEDIFHRRYYEPIHDMDQYVTYLQYIDTLKRVLSIEPEWHFSRALKEGEHPALHIHAPNQANSILALAMVVVKRPMHQVPILHEDWIQRYALAFCKEILGRVRGKWGNVPSPAGGQSLDAQTLLGEAKEELRELDTEIRGWQTDWICPIWG
jgi:hypothetical protein